MKKLISAALISLLSMHSPAQSAPRRMIDRCAQDGFYFYAWNDDIHDPVQAGRDGVTVRIERPVGTGENAVITFSRKGHKLVQNRKEFDAAEGWVTVSESGTFAATWNFSASATDTQLFRVAPTGDIIEDSELIHMAERQFAIDAKRYCRNSGLNTMAVKWIDQDRLLISVNAWASWSCQSNFTEGFVLNVTSGKIERKLTVEQLISLPAVCTWNIVPVGKR